MAARRPFKHPLVASAGALAWLASAALSSSSCGARTGLEAADTVSLNEGDGGDGGAAPGVPPSPPSLGCPGPSGLQAHAPWPMLMRCSTHAGWTEVVGPSTKPALQWVFSLPNARLPSGTAGMVIAADGTIYVAIGSEPLYALSPDGTVRWSVPVTCSDQPPAIGSDGTVYVGDNVARLYAIDPEGNQTWRYGQPGIPSAAISAPAVGPDGTIYVMIGQAGSWGELMALAPDGTQRWSHRTDDFTFPSVATSGNIYAGLGGGPGKPGPGTTPRVVLEALSSTGALRWSIESPSGGQAQAATLGPGETVLLATTEGTLLDVGSFAPDGGARWKSALGPNDGSPLMPAIDPAGTAYIASSSGAGGAVLFAVRPDGTPGWQVDLPGGPAFAPPIVDGAGVVYVATEESVIAVSPGGVILWSTLDATRTTSLAIGADGTLYAGTTQGSVFAWR